MSIQEFICSAKLRQTVVSVREAEGERRRQILREGDTAKKGRDTEVWEGDRQEDCTDREGKLQLYLGREAERGERKR